MAVSLASLSDRVRRYFLSPEIFAHYQVLAAEFGFEKQNISLLSTSVFQFAIGAIEQGDFLSHVAKATGLPETKAHELLSAIALNILSPVARDIPGLPEKISAFGASVMTEQNEVEPLTFIRSFIASFPESIEPNIQHRLEKLLSEYVSGERSKDDLIEFLQRPFKLAGLAIDEATARDLVESFDEKRASVVLATPAVIVSPESPVIARPAELAEATSAGIASSSHQGETAQVVSVFLEDEIAEAEKIIEPMVSVEEMVAKICATQTFQFTDPTLQKRCLDIVMAHVRGVRDAFQTRELLERPVDGGGLGVSGRRLADMLEQIEAAVDAAEREEMGKKEKSKQEEEDKKKEEKNQKQELIQKEEQVMAKRFVQTTGKVPTESIAPAAPALSRASAAISAHMQLQQQEARIDTQKVRAAVQETIKSEPPQSPAGRPRVQDVSFSRRLAGPVEELEAMSLTEFRRLAADPVQASERVKDVINLLDDQGYRKRVEGIQALRRSPLFQSYGSITQKALLSGTSVDAVLSSQKDKQGLKKAEYEALMKLNAELRF